MYRQRVLESSSLSAVWSESSVHVWQQHTHSATSEILELDVWFYLIPKMIIGYLICLGFLTACRATTAPTNTTTRWRPPHRGAFAPVPADSGTSPLSEGDIAPKPRGSGSTLSSYLADKAALWPYGRVRYRIDEDVWEGKWDPVFSDDQIQNISISLQKIEAGVPCIDFRWASSSLPHL